MRRKPEDKFKEVDLSTAVSDLNFYELIELATIWKCRLYGPSIFQDTTGEYPIVPDKRVFSELRLIIDEIFKRDEDEPYAYLLMGWLEWYENNKEKSAPYFEKAAECRLGESAKQLGVMFLYGDGVGQSDEDAYYWFSQDDTSESYFFKGEMNLFGLGRDRDVAKAKNYYYISRDLEKSRERLKLIGVDIKEDFIDGIKE